MQRQILKQLVKEIVAQTINAVQEVHDTFEMVDDDVVEIKGIQLPNGQKIDVVIGLEGAWQDDGFSYERGYDKGVHNMGSQYELHKNKVEAAYDSNTEQLIPLTPEIIDIALKEFDAIRDDVIDAINQNPSDQDSYGGPDPDEYDPSDDM